jgi:hypothetical protein
VKKLATSIVIISFLVGLALGWFIFKPQINYNIDNLVAMKWIDGKYGKGFYGVQIFYEPENDKYSVKGRIWIGRGNSYWRDLGTLGVVDSPEQAIQKFGGIIHDGIVLKVGNFTVPQKEIERHR